MGWHDKAEEDALYEKSRSLKFQAREMRKKRLADEEEQREKAERKNLLDREAALEARTLKAREARADRDNRIRKALLEMARIVKANNLAFEGPDNGKWMWANSSATVAAFKLIDKVSGSVVQINTRPDGFQWD